VIFTDTIAEMTWVEVERAAKDGAVLLWALGVIEQHGPHLPTGTDVYLPSARLREVRTKLESGGISALIMPSYYWGVNIVSGSFPASYGVRPELMRDIMVELLMGVMRDGFRHVFCFSGHGDALHNKTIYDGVAASHERTGIDVSFVTDATLAMRIGLDVSDPLLTVHDPSPQMPIGAQVRLSPPNTPETADASLYVDVHAGREETSLMMSVCPELVREEARAALRCTEYGLEDLAVWRRGYDDARRKTPQGYFGDPASATVDEGDRALAASAQAAADAIASRLQRMVGHIS